MKAKLITGLAVATVLSAPAVAYGASVSSQPTERTVVHKMREMPDLKTTGASWEGHYRWLPPGEKTRGAFNFKGRLTSSDKSNGAKLEVRVEGYSAITYRAARGKSKQYDELVYDGAAQQTKRAWAKVCRDRGSLVPDNCSKEMPYKRGE